MLGSADNSNQSSIRIFLENFAQMAHLFAEINAHDAVLKVEIVSESNSSESTCILIDGKDPDALSSISVKLDSLSFGESVDHTDHSKVGRNYIKKTRRR